MRLSYTWKLSLTKFWRCKAYIEHGLQSLKKKRFWDKWQRTFWKILVFENWWIGKKKIKLFKKTRQIMMELAEELGISESINWRMSFIQNLRRKKKSQVRKIDFIWNYGKEHQSAFKYFFFNAKTKKNH